jgi:hypothetical protein
MDFSETIKQENYKSGYLAGYQDGSYNTLASVRPRVGKKAASATPERFRDLLIETARRVPRGT